MTIPPNVVLTPLAALTAERPNEAVTGIEPTKEPNVWQQPRATISWEAATGRLAAGKKRVQCQVLGW